jgi:uncharacterized protein (TIGR04255 family)
MMGPQRYEDPAIVQALVTIDFHHQGSEPWERFDPPPAFIHRNDDLRQHFDINATDGAKITQTSQVIGRQWSDADQQRAVDVRCNRLGFIIHRGDSLDRPAWIGGSNLRNQARDVWCRLGRAVQNLQARKVAIRYVNRFDLPSGQLALSQYFRTLPDTSGDLPGRGLSQFLLQLDIPQPDHDAYIRFIMTRVPPPEDRPEVDSILLDIEAYRVLSQPRHLDDDHLGAILQTLHAVENEMFESTLNNAARRLMKWSAPTASHPT